ncbi:MAG TPA: transglycosylase SLT domain-containing protein [Ktedonobacterales bacterium]
MKEQRNRGLRRRGSQWTPSTSRPLPDSSSSGTPLDQLPTAHYSAPAEQATNVPAETLDDPMTLPTRTARTLTSGAALRRADLSSPGRTSGGPQTSQALVPLKTGAERDRALALANAASETKTTLIPGAKKYRAPSVSIAPRRSGPRSAIAQFAVSMIVTALVVSVLTLSTPLGAAASMSANGPVLAYAGAVPWIPTPTPTATPKPTPVPYRPPAGANPGQQAVINDIVAVFGSYSQGALNIARCESGYDPNAYNSYPILNSHASGVFQILYPSTWNTTSYSGYSPFDADANIHAAYQIFQRDGYSWREWQCKPY